MLNLKNKKTIGPIFIIIAAVLWGIDGILRRSLFTLPPSVIVFYEHLIGAILISPFLVPKLKQEKIGKKQWGALLWISILSGVIGTLLFTAALVQVNFISFSVVFLLQKLQPIFAISASRILLKEKISREYSKWALLALISAYFVTFPNGRVNLETGSGTIVAALFAVGAAFAWGSSTAFSRFGLLKLSHTLMTGLRFMLTTPLALLTVILLGKSSFLANLEADQYLRLLMIALSTGMVALWIYYRGLKQTQAKISTILELTFPLTAVAIDLFYFKTVLATSQYFAAGVLIFAIYKATLLNRKIA
jgi:drug/metabolite transporter (DMT)-like permease